MGWAKLDDGFMTHPKALAAGKDGRALYIAGLLYAAGQLTDGHIATAVLPLVAAAAEVRGRPTAARLVDVGLWETAGDGWWIHDYHDWNPAADAERAKRRARAEAGRKGGLRSKQTRSNQEANSQANPEANEEANGKPNGTPSPYPYLGDLPEQRSSRSYAPSTDSSPPVDKPDDLTTADQAYTLIADDQIAQHPPNGDPDKYRRSTIAGIRREHHDQAHRYLHMNPNLTAQALADLLKPPSPAPADHGPRPDPLAGQQAALLARAHDGTNQTKQLMAEPGDPTANLAAIANLRTTLTPPHPEAT
jgi:hypothetical protein